VTTIIVEPEGDKMTSTITTMDIRSNLGDLLNKVSIRHDEYIIERKGKPLAAMIPVEKLKAIERAARLQITEILDRSDAKISDDDLMALATEAKKESRK
jgi:prevent-host-death family protein